MTNTQLAVLTLELFTSELFLSFAGVSIVVEFRSCLFPVCLRLVFPRLPLFFFFEPCWVIGTGIAANRQHLKLQSSYQILIWTSRSATKHKVHQVRDDLLITTATPS